MSSSEVWFELLELARWSSSPHNVQPWKLQIISNTQATLYYLPDRLLPIEDPTGCFNTVGLGMFVENLSIAASAKQLAIQTTGQPPTLNAQTVGPQLFLNLTLIPRTETEPLNPQLLKKRHTSRLPYDGQTVDRAVLTAVTDVAVSYGQTFNFSQEPSLVDWVLQLNRDTIFYDMEDAAARNEIGHWLRYSSSQAHQKSDGLWAYCMGFPGWLMSAFFHHHRLFYLPLIHQLVRRYYLSTTAGTTTVAWLEGPFATPNDWFAAGRMLARIWLTLTQHDVYLHPFGSIITNPQSHQRLAERFNKHEDTHAPLWLLMRLGHSQPPPHSLRLPVESLVLEN